MNPLEGTPSHERSKKLHDFPAIDVRNLLLDTEKAIEEGRIGAAKLLHTMAYDRMKEYEAEGRLSQEDLTEFEQKAGSLYANLYQEEAA